MDSATNKRTRIDPQATNQGTKEKAPLEVAHEKIQVHVASLQDQLASILGRAAKSHLSALARHHHKQVQLSKMKDDDTFMPRSARLQFQLKTSKITENSDELKLLQAETKTAVDEFQTALKDKIMAATKLELKKMKANIHEQFCKHLHVIIQAWLITAGRDTIDPHKIVSSLLDRYPDQVLSTIDVTAQNFPRLYCTVHSLNELPAPFDSQSVSRATYAAAATRNTQSATRSRHFGNQNTNSQANSTETDTPQDTSTQPRAPNDEDKLISSLKRTLEAILADPWELFLHREKELRISLSLKKLSTTYFDTKATTDAAMEIDQEPAVSRTQMGNLIEQEVLKRTKKLENELKQLKTSISKPTAPKNSAKRGAKKSGPSQKQKPAAQKAAAADKDTTATDSSRKKQHKRNSSTKKKQGTQTGSRRPRTGSKKQS